MCASIIQCKYPKPYKHALICPVPKENPPNDIDNDFRQISVLPQLAKVLEKLQLSLHRQDLEVRNNQHAFIQNRSTVSALACISQKWFNATDNSPDGRMGAHALFLDFRKAFDVVDHGILLRKLAELNINKKPLAMDSKFFRRPESTGKTELLLVNRIAMPCWCSTGLRHFTDAF